MSVYVPAEMRLQVREHFAYRCAYCRTSEALTVAVFEVDHIMPRSAGGETVAENLCLACPACNRYKAARREVADPLTGRPTPLFHPRRDQWNTHFAWSEDLTEIEGLTATGRATTVALRMNRPQLIRARSMWVRMGEHPPPAMEETDHF